MDGLECRGDAGTPRRYCPCRSASLLGIAAPDTQASWRCIAPGSCRLAGPARRRYRLRPNQRWGGSAWRGRARNPPAQHRSGNACPQACGSAHRAPALPAPWRDGRVIFCLFPPELCAARSLRAMAGGFLAYRGSNYPAPAHFFSKTRTNLVEKVLTTAVTLEAVSFPKKDRQRNCAACPAAMSRLLLCICSAPR